MAWEKIKRYEASTPIAIEEGMIDNDPPIYEPIYEYHIPNALANGYGYITKNFKNIEETTSPRHRGSIPFTSIISNYFLKKKIHLDRPAISIANGWYDNFYHFSLECLAKLFVLKDYLPTSIVIMPKQLSKFHREWLDILGIKDVSYIDENEIISSLKVISCNFPNRDLNYHHQILIGLKEWILSKVKIQPISISPKILIGRPQGSKRNLSNIEEVKSALAKKGYTYIEMENYSLIEQISIFYQSTNIVAVHGAALTNLLFCQQGTKIIDLMHEKYNVLCFYKLSKHLELDYQLLNCKGEDGIKDSFGYKNFEVDINQLLTLIEDIR